MLPAAPGLFSTTIGWPSSSPIFGCMMRPTKSDAPPGAKGMIMRTGLLGYDCAIASAGMSSRIESQRSSLLRDG